MKSLNILAVSVWLMGLPALAAAQTTVATVAPVRPATKAAIKARIRAQEARINADSKDGKLTTVQATALLANLKAIRDKLKADYVENGKKELTGDQEVELTGMLDASEQSIGNRNGIQDFN